MQHRAPLVLAFALLFGAFTQALFWNAGLGANWLVWDLAMVATTLALLRRPRVKPTALGASLGCVLFGVALVLHRSELTTAIALPGSVVALAILPMIVGEDLGFDALVMLPTRLASTLGRTPSSIARTVFLPSEAVSSLDTRGRGIAKGIVLGLALGVPAAGLFALLLSADPGFAATVDHARLRLGSAATFAAYAAITAVIYVFAHALYVRTLREKQELASESATDAARANVAPFASLRPIAPYRKPEAALSFATVLSPLAFGLVVAQVAAVFGVFVLVHVDTEFGGHSVVRDRAGLTYASHLHAGFYQLLLATLLSVCLVLIGHALMAARTSAREANDHAPVPGGAILAALESALLVLTALTLVSCMQRLKLYEEAYGATHLRLAVGFIGLTVAGLLLCTLAKAIFRAFRGFVGAALTTVTACALAASMFDADAYVARVNLDRAARGAPLDEGYLGTLSADACAVVDHPMLADPMLRARLVRAWARSESSSDLRAFRGLTRCPASE